MDTTAATAAIVASFKKLQRPSHVSAWLGPFEQLLGAGYALMCAIKHGIYQRTLDSYGPRVQAKIVGHLENFAVAHVPSDHAGFDDWLSGFYFNAAVQRIVWAGERLLFTCAAVECACGHRTTEKSVAEDKPGWKKVKSGALARLDHVQKDGTNLTTCRAVLEQFRFKDASGKVREYRRADALDRTKILAMLRYTVNNRKHRIYIRGELRDQESAGKGDNQKWCSSGADFQMDLACEAFDLVCQAYEELRNWNPTPNLNLDAVQG